MLLSKSDGMGRKFQSGSEKNLKVFSGGCPDLIHLPLKALGYTVPKLQRRDDWPCFIYVLTRSGWPCLWVTTPTGFWRVALSPWTHIHFHLTMQLGPILLACYARVWRVIPVRPWNPNANLGIRGVYVNSSIAKVKMQWTIYISCDVWWQRNSPYSSSAI